MDKQEKQLVNQYDLQNIKSHTFNNFAEICILESKAEVDDDKKEELKAEAKQKMIELLQS